MVAWTQKTEPEHRRSQHGQLHHLSDPGRDRRRQQQGGCRVGADRLQRGAVPGSGRGLATRLQRHPHDRDGRPPERAWSRPSATPTAAGRRRSSSRARAPRRPRPCSRVPLRSSRGTPRRASRSSTPPSRMRPGASDYNLQPQIGNCCGYSPKMALDSAGHLWIAWYSNATGATGMYVQQLDADDRRRRSARPPRPPTARAATTTASARRWRARRPAVSSTATRRPPGRPTRSSPGGRARAHRRRSPTSRAPGRAPGACSPPPTARTGASGSPGSTARPTARRSATLAVRAARRRMPACRRGRRAAPTRSPAWPSATTSCWLRTTRGTRPGPCRSRSS